MKPKIFGIGTHKTGTTSLGDALKMLGFAPHCGWGQGNKLTPASYNGNYEKIFKVVDKYVSFEDSPWCHGNLYKILYKQFPTAKFILTIRNEDDWFNSLVRWTNNNTGCCKWGKMYHNIEYGNKLSKIRPFKENYVNIYRKRNQEIIDFFADKPNTLLIIDFASGEGWNELCKFLNVPIPIRKFPHSNQNKKPKQRR